MSINNTAHFFKECSLGAAQVMLQTSGITGCLFISGILLGSIGIGGNGTPSVFFGATASLAIATAANMLFRHGSTAGGTAGFNAILVGCATFAFLTADITSYALMIAAAVMTLIIKAYFGRMFARWGLSSLTLPFIVATWAMIYIGQLTSTTIPLQPETSTATACISALEIIKGLMKGLSQIFLIDSWVTGCVFLVGLLAAGHRAAVWALTGSATGMATAFCIGCQPTEIAAGLWGFSPALTAIAIGVTFRKSDKWQWNMVTVAATIVTVFIQHWLTPCLGSIGLPVLTLPFCIVTWVVAGFSQSRPAHPQPPK